MTPLKIVNTEHFSHFVREFYISNLEILKKRFTEKNGEEALTQLLNPEQSKKVTIF